jgi:NADH:ubiquinone oxidoreductase subunit E
MDLKKNVIQICMGSSCFSRGNSGNLEIIKNFIEDNKINAEVNLKGHLCANKCDKGPIIKINNEVFEAVSESGISKILESKLL